MAFYFILKQGFFYIYSIEIHVSYFYYKENNKSNRVEIYKFENEIIKKLFFLYADITQHINSVRYLEDKAENLCLIKIQTVAFPDK
jgi:hypothetical protein